jgi:glucose/arabinose dehydrogenase
LSGLAFLGPNDLLVTEKNTGKVNRIQNGTVSNMLDLNVANDGERGLLGIAVGSRTNNHTYVFLYLTETEDIDTNGTDTTILGNRLYRYELNENKSNLIHPKLLLNLSADPGPYHNGGTITIGPDNYIYLAVGDIFLNNSQAANTAEGDPPDGRAGILRLDFDGNPVGDILGETFPLNLYYAYGIRNSFGLDFDPFSGKLWNSENGPYYGDEINLVEPGFNSGWRKVHGIWKVDNLSRAEIEGAGSVDHDPTNLVTFDGSGTYRSPALTWHVTTGPTAVKFINSTIFGNRYEGDLLVSDVNGRIYLFTLGSNRTELLLEGDLSDKVVDRNEEIHSKIWAQDMGIITDMDFGPDGYLYVLSNEGRWDTAENSGKVLRIG